MMKTNSLKDVQECDKIRKAYEQKIEKLEQHYQEQLKKFEDEARRANMAKTDFLRRMSHDMRTPINAINGYVQIANTFPDDLKRQQECRDKILKASGYLLEMIKSVLDMSKLESGEMVLEHKPFDLMVLLEKVCHVMTLQASEAGIACDLNDIQIMHTHLVGSPKHIQQILMNLLSNAIRYNRYGGSIKLQCREIEERADVSWFEFICADTGIGMSEAFQQHIFEPFTQESDGVKTRYEGTGLGLPITKNMITLMNGTIDFRSRQGEGTVFTVRLPMTIDRRSSSDKRQSDRGMTKNLAGLKILLVEDNEMNMEIAEFLLREQMMEVDRAWDGAQAVELFAHSQERYYDVILMDIMMPVMDGLEATRQIRKLQREDAKTVPIFAMSANTFIEDMEESKKAGMDEYFTKPLDMNAISEMIGEYCR